MERNYYQKDFFHPIICVLLVIIYILLCFLDLYACVNSVNLSMLHALKSKKQFQRKGFQRRDYLDSELWGIISVQIFK